MVGVLSLLIGLAAPSLAQDEAEALPEASEPDLESWQEERMGFAGLPAVNYNADEGFGFGAILGIYKYDGKTAPYKWSLDNQLFMTTRNVHHHRVIFDVLDLAGGKLRISGRVKFEASRAEHYCGLGAETNCDPGIPEDQADDLGLTGDARDEYLRRFYKMRYIMPYAIATARWELRDKPHRLEVFGGWRVNYNTPGDLGESGPWKDTRYIQDHPEGEKGLVSVLQVGFMADNRRNEAAPYSGYWAEASIRGSSRFWGSNRDWEYVGVNTILRGYVPLTKNDGLLVLANRVAFDGIVGDTSVQDLAWSGGSGLLTFGGGVDSGRGIRARRFRGRADLLAQSELRARFVKFDIGGVPFDFGGAGFIDAGMTSLEWKDFGNEHEYYGTGGGIRLTMDQNFVIQADVGVSPVENWSPSVYIETGNTL